MKTAVSVNTMRESDFSEIRSGTDSRELMQRAGRAIFECHTYDGKTAVVCGSGNNAGDGYVLAYLLAESSLYCKLFLCEEKFSPDGAFYFEKCRSAGVEYEILTENTDLSQFDTVVDCIFGTGFKGAPCGIYKTAIEKINESGSFVICADINSGLNGDNGLSETAVNSDITLAVGFEKTGHHLGSAKDRIKKLICADIGIHLCGKGYFIPEKGDFHEILRKRENNSHKGTYGYTAIIAGCTEYSGAAKLANIACCALRSGCGVTRLAVPRSICDYVAPYLLESTLFPVPDENGKMKFDPNVLDGLMNSAAISVGMGWGRSESYSEILSYLLENYKGRLIIDADGLNTLAMLDRELIKNTACEGVILTPHPLEFSRISSFPTEKIMTDPIMCATEYAAGFGGKIILLLKGTSTIITDGDNVYIVNRGCPGMATAGSGDVLSGIMTGIHGYNSGSLLSVACAAYIAGFAGELSERKTGSISMLASDTVSMIPQAVLEMTEQNKKRQTI